MGAVCISAIASNHGKTLLTTALLYHFKKSVRPFKVGPDYIDTQFHQKICNTPSINLDSFMMQKEQVKWIYNNYSDKDISIVEGVMGFYDGMDKGCSTYEITKLLKIPTILIVDASGSYITQSAVLKGLKTYKKDNTIKGVILNKLSSYRHFKLIKKCIEKDSLDIAVLGWIKKDLQSLKHTHLGLDLQDLDKIEKISKEVLENIEIKKIKRLSTLAQKPKIKDYPFKKIKRSSKKLAIVKDKNFSFLYQDNIEFLKEVFSKVVFIDSTKDETIPQECDALYIPGGYVETSCAYDRIKNSHNFKRSLKNHAKTKPIYAECAGLLYLSNRVDDKKMSGILKLDFEFQEKRSRLGYYYANNFIKGHAFHYTKPINPPIGVDILSKEPGGLGEFGSWQNKRVYGTFLHTMFRNNTSILRNYFGI
jgi:cobyrinic acid a,c-diamide synthase